MKIKKPRRGDIVIYKKCLGIVASLAKGSSSTINIVLFRSDQVDCVDDLCETEFHEAVRYPDWEYPQLSDEMIEVDDETWY